MILRITKTRRKYMNALEATNRPIEVRNKDSWSKLNCVFQCLLSKNSTNLCI